MGAIALKRKIQEGLDWTIH